jgi:hypothetical protein
MTQSLRSARGWVPAGSAAPARAAILFRPAVAAFKNTQDNLKVTGDRIGYAIKTES